MSSCPQDLETGAGKWGHDQAIHIVYQVHFVCSVHHREGSCYCTSESCHYIGGRVNTTTSPDSIGSAMPYMALQSSPLDLEVQVG